MSKSLEALERLCKVKIYQKEASAYDYLGKEIYKEEINTIKQELECKEELLKENQELKQELEIEKFDWFIVLNNKLDRYKKAIEILKDKLKLSLNDNEANKTINAVLPIGNNDMNRLTQQEYELLKEVLKDDK